MATSSALLVLFAETPIHAGAGQMMGVIDLPIQREQHLQWPCVYGSGLKGALRGKAETENLGEKLYDVFGPDTGNASDHAGALAIGDARLLLLPVRSLTSHFKWVTCPAAIQRFRADAERLGLDVSIPEFASPAEDAVLIPEVAEKEKHLFLEEFRLESKEGEELGALIEALAQIMPREGAADALKQQLAVVHNDVFKHLAMYSTPVAAHIKIKNETKTVQDGALWYEESLPPDTLLYSCLLANNSRRNGQELNSTGIIDWVTNELLPKETPYLQVGGNETVGMGWCKTRIMPGKNGQKEG